jgi:DNA-binding GntR family transcriptional regulator
MTKLRMKNPQRARRVQRKPRVNQPAAAPAGAISIRDQSSETTHMTASVFATTRLREAILNGELGPGDRLQQHLLASQLGLSHVPLREAFQRLEYEGFIAISPRRGAFVVPLTASDAAEIFELRVSLETAALRASVQRLCVEEILVATEVCRKADQVKDKLAYGELNWQFHRAIYASCQRPRTLNLIETLWRNASRYSALLRHRDPYLRQSQQEHWDMLEAVGRKDAELACRLLRTHIEGAAGRILKLF